MNWMRIIEHTVGNVRVLATNVPILSFIVNFLALIETIALKMMLKLESMTTFSRDFIVET